MPKAPKSKTPPGLEATRSERLDNICEGIAEERARLSAARTEEQQLLSSALQTRQERKISVYKHAGVELARVPVPLHVLPVAAAHVRTEIPVPFAEKHRR